MNLFQNLFKLIDQIVEYKSNLTEKNEYAADLFNDNHERNFHYAVNKIDFD